MADSQNAAIAPTIVRREHYRPPTFLIDRVDLTFALDPSLTVVTSRLTLRRNPAGSGETTLNLDGEALNLRRISLDGEELHSNRYTLTERELAIADVPETFTLETEVEICPERNSELSGLYVSGGNFFTQCEAEGFRRITFFPDRPDVMSRYTTTIIADRERYPVLLSNGNPQAERIEGSKHIATWIDPHPKPCYLFALVAGDLVPVRDQFTTASGRAVALAIWVRRGDEDRCAHAMLSLKRAMAWDEQTFGLEYDLDVFNIAAVSDFNMGAMENKGLNVFNTKYVLAKPETATDSDYQSIETVVAHEYFHNWTGNRVTCRDWFQLSLKEGLTVFRDQQFAADLGSAAVKRIGDVRRLRAAQFREDDGPLAHPVRPDSYMKIDNFYTATVYQKGAEVVRMIHTLLGPANFRKGMDLYIGRHDNHAVAIEDFVQAMQDASGIDLSRFSRWYSQAGTPIVTTEETYDPAARRLTLTVRQTTKPTPGQPEKHPVPIPLAIGLLDRAGQPIAMCLEGDTAATADTRVLLADEAEQHFVFVDVPSEPVSSLLRGFSAPVKLEGLSRERFQFLAAHDSDPFVRWDSGQQYAIGLTFELIAAFRRSEPLWLDPGLVSAFLATLNNADADPAFAAEAMTLPAESLIADQMETADVEAIHAVREFLRIELARAANETLLAAYDRLDHDTEYAIDSLSMGRRALKNVSLAYLAVAGQAGIELAYTQYKARRNMTDVLAALGILCATDSPERTEALDDFYHRWRHDELVLDKWFALQALSPLPGTLAAVETLSRHPDFDLRNPNRVRSLVGNFASNQVRFHDGSSAGYRFLAEKVMALDPLNAQVAARMVTPLGAWRRQDRARQELMQEALRSILAMPGLSRNTYEQVSKSLG